MRLTDEPPWPTAKNHFPVKKKKKKEGRTASSVTRAAAALRDKELFSKLPH